MRAIIFSFFILCFAGWPGLSFAQNLPPSCDATFMEVMEIRSWMEGNREMEAAQTLIVKPDSVLEYSCFKTRLDQMADWPPWSDGKANMRGALNKLAGASTDEYLGKNFDHDLGGGAVSPACDAMAAVWEVLKCANFDKDDFWTFAALVNEDPRTFSKACNVSTRGAVWQAAIAASSPPPGSGGGVEQVVTHLNRLDPAQCGSFPPVPTGVVRLFNDRLVEDAVCAAPGCYYDGAGACRVRP